MTCAIIPVSHLLHTNRLNLPTHTFPLVLRSDSRPNILLEFLHYLYESAPEFEALSRPSGIRDSRVSLTVQSAGAEYTALQQKSQLHHKEHACRSRGFRHPRAPTRCGSPGCLKGCGLSRQALPPPQRKRPRRILRPGLPPRNPSRFPLQAPFPLL